MLRRRRRRSTRTTWRSGDKAKLALFEEAAGWADERRASAPKDANAHYLYAFALGRYSQGISVTKALAQGFGGKIKEALLTAIKLEPKHADASTAYGAYQAEVIDKVGGIVAGMTYGAKKDSALEYFQKALKLFPESPIAHIEYANGLMHAVRQVRRSTRRQSSTKRRQRRSRWMRWSASTSSSRRSELE